MFFLPSFHSPSFRLLLAYYGDFPTAAGGVRKGILINRCLCVSPDIPFLHFLSASLVKSSMVISVSSVEALHDNTMPSLRQHFFRLRFKVF